MSVDGHVKNDHLPQTNGTDAIKNNTKPQSQLNSYLILGQRGPQL